MPNTINLPQGIQTMLDEVYKKESCTAVLNSSPSDLRPTQNVNEFCYPQLSVGGLGNYSRNSGYTSNAGVNLVWKTVQANYDRGTKIEVDVVDNQESFDIAFGKTAGVLMREHVAPEGDAFTFATIAGKTGITDMKPAGETFSKPEDLLASILEATVTMDEAEVPADQRYLFITPTNLKSVKALDTTKSREALDGFAGIVEVPQSRFNTAITLNATNGWAAAGKALNYMIIHKPAVIKYDKHVASDVIDPSANPDSDAYISKYRRYGVVDVYDNKLAGVVMHHKA